MEVRIASQAAPGRRRNEDFAFAVPGLAGVLDGVSLPEGLDSGCVHGTTWYVRHLAANLTRVFAADACQSLTQLLGHAIDQLRGQHEDLCDLNHPGTPASTVSLIKQSSAGIEYLALCDSPIVLERANGIETITDENFLSTVADIRGTTLTGANSLGSRMHLEQVRQAVLRQREQINRDGGYWIAAANPEASQHAVTGAASLTGDARITRAALLTDGASCAVETFALLDWRGLLDVLTEHGPDELIRRVRAAETADSRGHLTPRYKLHDDATAVLCLFKGTRHG